jgi:molecular chaperone GrpE (heat shock protein)
MTNEEFDRKAEFLLNQQARFDADMQKLKEVQAETEQLAKRTAKNVDGLTISVDSLTTVVDHLTSVVDDLARVTHEGFRFVIRSFKDTNAKLDVLADSQILTNERLQNLITVVDGHIREGHRGLNSA